MKISFNLKHLFELGFCKFNDGTIVDSLIGLNYVYAWENN